MNRTRALQLSIAWRVVIGRGRRRAMLLGLFAVPVLLAALSAGSLQWITASAEQRATDQMGSASALILPGDVPPTAERVSALPGGQGIALVEQVDSFEYPMFVGGTTTLVGYRETDWEHGPGGAAVEVRSGALPTRVGEVAVTERLAARWHLAIGDSVRSRWSADAARVTGVVRIPQGHLAQRVMAAPGQAAAWKDPLHAAEYGTQSTWLVTASDPGQLAPLVAAAGDAGLLVRTRADVRAARSMVESEPGVVMIPGVLLVSVGAAAAFSIRMRRLQHEFALLSAIGLDSRWILTTCRLAGVTAALWGATVGYAVGTGLSMLARPLLRAVVHKDLSPVVLPWGRGLALLLLSAVCAVVAVWWPTRLAQRRPVAQRVQAPSRDRGSWRLRLVAVGGGLAAAALATSVLISSRADSSLLATAGSVGLFLVLLGAVPGSLRLLARAAGPASATLRISLRNLAREPRRPVAAVSIGIFAVASSTATMVILASSVQDQRNSHVGSRHLGQIEVLLRHTDDVTAVSQALAAEFGPRVHLAEVKDVTEAPPPSGNAGASRLSVPVWRIAGPPDARTTVGNSRIEYGDRPVGAVDTPEEFRAVTGRTPTEPEWRVISEDGLLVLHPAYQQDGVATVMSPTALRVDRIALASGTDATTIGRAGALLSSRKARELGATVRISSVMITSGTMPPADTTARLAKVLEPLGIPVTDVRIERGPSGVVPTKWYLALSLGSVAAAVSILLALSASAQELRPDLRKLFEMGFPPASRRRITAWQSTVIALLSALCGAVAGLVIGASRLWPYDIAIAVPWAPLSAFIIGPIMLSVILSPFLAPSGRRLRTNG
ncbi:FtsX-like permease family protein [Kitasatospora sp. NPDC057500]|uniref:FtsX-like permease family protein n=1 Tax=Kitasatospora sp. NPDC057500 TaxID=3346151 RepID=UPI003693A37A